MLRCRDVAWPKVESGKKKGVNLWRKRGEMWGRLSSWLSMWLDACSSSCLSSPRPSRTGLSSCRCWKIFFPVIGCRTSSLSYVGCRRTWFSVTMHKHGSHFQTLKGTFQTFSNCSYGTLRWKFYYCHWKWNMTNKTKSETCLPSMCSDY